MFDEDAPVGGGRRDNADQDLQDVERNRLFVLIKNFPTRDLWVAPFFSLARYLWHAAYLIGGKGKAAEFASAGGGSALKLPWYVARAQFAALRALPYLLRERRRIQHGGRMQPRQFDRMLSTYGISPRRVAAL